MSPPKQSRISGAISLVIAQALVLVFGYVTHLWIGRVLGPATYGTYGVVLSIQTIIGLILTLGVPTALSRFVAQNEEMAHSLLRQALKTQTVVAFTVAVVTWLGAPLLSNVLGDHTLINLIRFSGLVVFAQAFYPVFNQFLSGSHTFNKQALLTALYATTKLIGAIALLYIFELYGALAGFAIGGACAALVGWYWTRRQGSASTEVPYRAFLTFAGLYVLVLIGIQVLISLDLFMVKAYLTDDVVTGYYNAAVTLARVPFFLLQALSFVLLPSVSALTTTDASRDEAIAFISDTLRYLIMLIIPGAALAASTSENLILLFFNREYLPAAPILTILMIGLSSIAFYLLLTNIVAGAGKAKISLWVTVLLLCLSAALGAILIPRWGLNGAAWQTTLTGLIGLMIMGSYTFYTFKIPVPWRTSVNVILASGLAILPTYFWSASPLTLPLVYVLAGVLYLLALIFLREVKPRDWQRLASQHPYLNQLIRRYGFIS